MDGSPGHTAVKDIGAKLESLYAAYNRRRFVSPDPLEVLYDYEDPLDREVAGVVASSLAYGRVAQILRNVRKMMDTMGRTPYRFLLSAKTGRIRRALTGFKHRFTDAEAMTRLLAGTAKVLNEYGSLEYLLAEALQQTGGEMRTAQDYFVNAVRRREKGIPSFLLPTPLKGSACKRLNLFFRWMVRKDEVDPGCWKSIQPRVLMVPLDVHMFRICKRLFPNIPHKSAGAGAVMEVTKRFRRITPEDPVKYDFVLTRFGIHPEMEYAHLHRHMEE